MSKHVLTRNYKSSGRIFCTYDDRFNMLHKFLAITTNDLTHNLFHEVFVMVSKRVPESLAHFHTIKPLPDSLLSAYSNGFCELLYAQKKGEGFYCLDFVEHYTKTYPFLGVYLNGVPSYIFDLMNTPFAFPDRGTLVDFVYSKGYEIPRMPYLCSSLECGHIHPLTKLEG